MSRMRNSYTLPALNEVREDDFNEFKETDNLDIKVMFKYNKFFNFLKYLYYNFKRLLLNFLIK